MKEYILSFYDYLKNYLIGVLPPGFEWVYVFVILSFFVVVMSTFVSFFNWRKW